jgi:hypothetical protein
MASRFFGELVAKVAFMQTCGADKKTGLLWNNGGHAKVMARLIH